MFLTVSSFSSLLSSKSPNLYLECQNFTLRLTRSSTTPRLYTSLARLSNYTRFFASLFLTSKRHVFVMCPNNAATHLALSFSRT